jgi:hypothetical protein
MRGIKLNDLQLLFTTLKYIMVIPAFLLAYLFVAYGHEHICCSGEPARAMMAIQENFGVKNNWMGDPCAPKSFAWGGLNCSYSSGYPSRITGM